MFGTSLATALSYAFALLSLAPQPPAPERTYPAPRQAEAPVPIQRVPVAQYREPPPEEIRCTADGCEVAK